MDAGEGAICLRLLHTFSITSIAAWKRSSSTPTSNVVLPARRKPPVVASLVTPKPSFINWLIKREASSSCTIAMINFIRLSLPHRSLSSVFSIQQKGCFRNRRVVRYQKQPRLRLGGDGAAVRLYLRVGLRRKAGTPRSSRSTEAGCGAGSGCALASGCWFTGCCMPP